MIVEFFGLPGSGKSTLSKVLEEMLCSANQKVTNYSDFKGQANHGWRILFKAFNISGLKFLTGSILFLSVNRLWFHATLVKRILWCVSFFTYYRNKKSDYILMDEGAVQGIISSLYDISPKYKLFNLLISALPSENIKFIYVDISTEEANRRIVKRAQFQHGRCDAIQDKEERMKVLNVQKDNFEKINIVLSRKYNVLRSSQYSNKELFNLLYIDK